MKSKEFIPKLGFFTLLCQLYLGGTCLHWLALNPHHLPNTKTGRKGQETEGGGKLVPLTRSLNHSTHTNTGTHTHTFHYCMSLSICAFANCVYIQWMFKYLCLYMIVQHPDDVDDHTYGHQICLT